MRGACGQIARGTANALLQPKYAVGGGGNAGECGAVFTSDQPEVVKPSLGQGMHRQRVAVREPLHPRPRQDGIAQPLGHGQGICPIWLIKLRSRKCSAPR